MITYCVLSRKQISVGFSSRSLREGSSCEKFGSWLIIQAHIAHPYFDKVYCEDSNSLLRELWLLPIHQSTYVVPPGAQTAQVPAKDQDVFLLPIHFNHAPLAPIFVDGNDESGDLVAEFGSCFGFEFHRDKSSHQFGSRICNGQ